MTWPRVVQPPANSPSAPRLAFRDPLPESTIAAFRRLWPASDSGIGAESAVSKDTSGPNADPLGRYGAVDTGEQAAAPRAIR